MGEEIRSLTTDFGGTWNQSQFHQEIVAEGAITTTLVGVSLGDPTADTVKIIFTAPLGGAEVTALNTLITSHVPVPAEGNSIANISISNGIVDLTQWVNVGNFTYPGTLKWSNTTHIKASSVMEDGGTSYDIKIFDDTNDNTIASVNLTNTVGGINDLGTLSNLPAGEADFEVWAKVTGTTTAHVKSISVYYN